MNVEVFGLLPPLDQRGVLLSFVGSFPRARGQGKATRSEPQTGLSLGASQCKASVVFVLVWSNRKPKGTGLRDRETHSGSLEIFHGNFLKGAEPDFGGWAVLRSAESGQLLISVLLLLFFLGGGGRIQLFFLETTTKPTKSLKGQGTGRPRATKEKEAQQVLSGAWDGSRP